MNDISIHDINNLPLSFIQGCIDTHSNGPCQVCTLAANGLTADMAFSTLSWMQKKKLPPCVWSLGKYIWTSLDNDNLLRQKKLADKVIYDAKYNGMNEETLLDTLMEACVDRLKLAEMDNSSFRECLLKMMYGDGLRMNLAQCSITMFFQPSLLYYYTITNTKMPKVMRAFQRLDEDSHRVKYKEIGEIFLIRTTYETIMERPTRTKTVPDRLNISSTTSKTYAKTAAAHSDL